jgi:SAM-dependent methyltransferase
MSGSITDDERAGGTEPFEDAALYDWEYRRRRQDVAFYRMLANERPGPILDLGCGTGRLTLPLARDGHRVVGVDAAPAMLARAALRLRRASRIVSQRCLLTRADLRNLPLGGRFPLAIAAFHTVQHLVDDRDLIAFFRQVRRLIEPDGWFAFDLFFPDPRWLARPPNREFDRTIFRHPTTGQKLAYTVAHRLDESRHALHMTFRYQPIDADGSRAGRTRIVRLCHRQLPPRDVKLLLRRAGLEILARWGGFRGEPLTDEPDSEAGSPPFEQHVYLTGPTRTAGRRHAPRQPGNPPSARPVRGASVATSPARPAQRGKQRGQQ